MIGLKNYHAIKVSFKHTGHPHVILTSQRFPHNRKVLDFDYRVCSIEEQACKWLEEHGFPVVAQTELSGDVSLLLTSKFEKL